jgi:hypothetical protein
MFPFTLLRMVVEDANDVVVSLCTRAVKGGRSLAVRCCYDRRREKLCI